MIVISQQPYFVKCTSTKHFNIILFIENSYSTQNLICTNISLESCMGGLLPPTDGLLSRCHTWQGRLSPGARSAPSPPRPASTPRGFPPRLYPTPLSPLYGQQSHCFLPLTLILAQFWAHLIFVSTFKTSNMYH